MASVFTPRAVTTEGDFEVALAMIKRIFSDPADLETDDKFRRCFDDPRIARYYLFDIDGVPAGVTMVRIHPEVPDAMYAPYGGVLPEHRGWLTPAEAIEINKGLMADLGVHMLLMDVEDPARIRHVYPDEEPDRVVRRCETRLHFFEHWLGWTFVDDPELPYCRPSSADPRKVQAYDLLGFYLRAADDPRWRGIFNTDRTEIRLDAYVRWYLELMQLELGTSAPAMTPAELSSAYPAIGRFLEQSKRRPGKKWVRLRVAPQALPPEPRRG